MLHEKGFVSKTKMWLVLMVMTTVLLVQKWDFGPLIPNYSP